MMVLAMPRPAPVSPKTATRSPAERRATLSIGRAGGCAADRDQRGAHPGRSLDGTGGEHLLVIGRQPACGDLGNVGSTPCTHVAKGLDNGAGLLPDLDQPGPFTRNHRL